MNANGRVLPPTTDDIERRFHSPGVIVTRPVILGGIRVLRAARRFGWEPRGLEHLSEGEVFRSHPATLSGNAMCDGIEPGQHRNVRRQRPARLRVGVLEDDGFFRQRVDVR